MERKRFPAKSLNEIALGTKLSFATLTKKTDTKGMQACFPASFQRSKSHQLDCSNVTMPLALVCLTVKRSKRKKKQSEATINAHLPPWASRRTLCLGTPPTPPGPWRTAPRCTWSSCTEWGHTWAPRPAPWPRPWNKRRNGCLALADFVFSKVETERAYVWQRLLLFRFKLLWQVPFDSKINYQLLIPYALTQPGAQLL